METAVGIVLGGIITILKVTQT